MERTAPLQPLTLPVPPASSDAGLWGLLRLPVPGLLGPLPQLSLYTVGPLCSTLLLSSTSNSLQPSDPANNNNNNQNNINEKNNNN